MKSKDISKQHIHEFKEDNHEYKLVVDYGLHKFKDQEPYFSITASLYKKLGGYWIWISGGCSHDLIRKYVPRLEHLIKWHLCFVESGPMHYESNAVFWWERSLMETAEPCYKGDNCAISWQALEHFMTTVVYGISSYDKLFIGKWDRKSFPITKLREWLKFRLPELLFEFNKDMARHGLVLTE